MDFILHEECRKMAKNAYRQEGVDGWDFLNTGGCNV